MISNSMKFISILYKYFKLKLYGFKRGILFLDVLFRKDKYQKLRIFVYILNIGRK